MKAEGKGIVEPLCIGTVRGVVQGVEVGQEGVAGGGVGRRHWGRVRRHMMERFGMVVIRKKVRILMMLLDINMISFS